MLVVAIRTSDPFGPVISPPTYKSPPIPTPPATINAPVVVLVILIALLVVDPRLVTLCNVLVVHTVTLPVLVLTAVSVPAVRVKYVLELTEIVPSSLTLIPSPILTPPIVLVVAVFKLNVVPVLTDIVPSALTSMPVPILTPPNVSEVAVVKL